MLRMSWTGFPSVSNSVRSNLMPGSLKIFSMSSLVVMFASPQCSRAAFHSRCDAPLCGIGTVHCLSPRVDRAFRGRCFNPKERKTQHGVKALDGGDADAADAVELRGLQVLDVVKLGELAAVVGRNELLEFFQGLVAEVAAVDEEEDAARAGELDEAVNGVDGGVGLAAAGGHLDEGAAFVGGERFLQIADGFDLRGPQIGRRHLISGEKIREAGVELRLGLDPLEQSLGFVKGEDVATFR